MRLPSAPDHVAANLKDQAPALSEAILLLMADRTNQLTAPYPPGFSTAFRISTAIALVDTSEISRCSQSAG